MTVEAADLQSAPKTVMRETPHPHLSQRRQPPATPIPPCCPAIANAIDPWTDNGIIDSLPSNSSRPIWEVELASIHSASSRSRYGWNSIQQPTSLSPLDGTGQLQMDISEFNALENQVLSVAFVASAGFGAIAQRTNFCTMGAISDIFNMGNWVRMRMWGMAVGVAIVGFAVMAWLGWINPTATIYSSSRVLWLSALVGGAMFGFGMVLASGCGSKTLVRIGEGNLKSLVVFFVMGFAAYTTMRGMTALLKSETVDHVAFEMKGGNAVPAWLSGVLGVDLGVTFLVLGLVTGGSLIVWAVASSAFRASAENLLAGLGIGGVIAFMWWVIGDLGFVSEHPETMDSVYLGTAGGRMQALSFTSPMARTLDYFMSYDSSKRLTLGVVSVFGVVVGALAYALYNRSFHWEGFAGARDTGLHIVGAMCMGVGGVTAGGCTVGQGLSGISTLSLTSMFAVAGIMLGAVIGLKFQLWLIMRE